jgi:hypothetical protein
VYLGTLLVAEGSNSVNVKAGENSPVSIKMKEAPPVFTAIADFAAWLNTKKDNNDTPYNVRLNISSLNGDSHTSGSLGNALLANPYKQIKLDLSGSTFTTIPDSAFYHCVSLTSVTIPNSVTSIGNLAFTYCESLTGVTFAGSNITSFGNNAFPLQ